MDYVHCRYFNKHGWPTSTILPNAPTNEEEQATLIDTIQVHCHRVELCFKIYTEMDHYCSNRWSSSAEDLISPWLASNFFKDNLIFI